MHLLLVFFISFSASAVTISKIRTAPEGTAVQTYSIVRGKGTLERKTNLFENRADLRLGTFSSKSDFSLLEKELDGIAGTTKIPVSLDEIGHRTFFKLNDKIISPESPVHMILEREFAQLGDKEWAIETGLEIEPELRVLKMFRDGRQTSSELLSVAFYCSRKSRPTVCAFPDKGILYVE